MKAPHPVASGPDDRWLVRRGSVGEARLALRRDRRNLVTRLERPSESGRSILELRGLGKELWDGIDAQEYVNELRNEWPDR